MKFVLTSLALAALLQAANADFDVHRAGLGGNDMTFGPSFGPDNSWDWQVYDPEDEGCDSAIDWTWMDSDDVSGGKYGVRCKGEGDSCAASSDPSGLEQLEFNFNGDGYHWTLYTDSDWGVYDLDDNLVGSCEESWGDNWYCSGAIGQIVGNRKIHCTMEGVTAADINANRPT